MSLEGCTRLPCTILYPLQHVLVKRPSSLSSNRNALERLSLKATGRKLAQQNLKLRATELAESGTAIRSRDVAELKTLVKRALIMNGMSPTKDQVCVRT